MTTLTDAIARAERAQADLIKALAEARKGKEEWPKVGDRVWYLATEGVCSGVFHDEEWCKSSLARGNVYRTRAEAERADQRRIIEAELRKMARGAGKVGKGWYELYHYCGKWSTFCTQSRSGTPRFPTRESAEAAIAALGDRLNLLLDEGE